MLPVPPAPVARAADFSRLLNPRGIAVVGASHELHRIGGQPVRNLTDLGYPGKVYPVNPKYREIKQLPCYPEIAAVPHPCDLAVIAVAAKHVPAIIRDCGTAKIPFAVILSSGFGETGAAGAALQEQLRAAIDMSGVRVVGPNCVGVMNLKTRMFCGMGTGFQDPGFKAGPVAMVTQSGGVGFAVVSLAQRAGVGFDYVVSSGNEVDITTPDLLEHFLRDDGIELVATYMEGINDGRRLIEVGQLALQLGKPIVVWKSGNTRSGRQAAASHTANLTAGYEIYQAASRTGGFVPVHDVHDFADIVQAHRCRKLPKGNKVAIVTTSGGAGVVLADHCEESGLTLPPIDDVRAGELRKVLPEFAAISNPLDMTAQGQNDLGLSPHNKVVKIMLDDPAIDQVIVRNGNVHGDAGRVWARELIEIAEHTPKPIMVSWGIVIAGTDPVVEQLRAGNVPCFSTPARLASAMGALTRFAARRDRHLSSIPGSRPGPKVDLEFPRLRSLGEHRSKAMLCEYGIASVREIVLKPEALETLTELPLAFPLAVKIESPDVLHKTEAGAVQLGIRSPEELRSAAGTVLDSVRRNMPDARIEGVLIQEMTTGIETIAGVVNDPTFGPIVMFGLGGVLTELLNDVSYRFAPFDAATALEMVHEIKASPVLTGYRGKPAGDLTALADCLSRLSWFAADHADRIAEIDINPLFVRPKGEGVVAADGLIVLK